MIEWLYWNIRIAIRLLVALNNVFLKMGFQGLLFKLEIISVTFATGD